MSSRLCIILVLYIKILHVTCQGNSSLTFVIDDTFSMTEEIDQVIRGSRDLLDYVLNTKSSEIEDLVLVTFNDPDVILREKTYDKTEFIQALEGIHVHNYENRDCPEYSMKGIITALEKSRSDSYLYVFTDANAKDYKRVDDVINLCEKKQSQVTFILTGKCGRSYDSKGYNVYYEIAKACSGSVIKIGEHNVYLAIDIIKHFVGDKKTIVTIKTVEPQVRHKFFPTPISFTLDEKIEHTIITVSGRDAQFDIRKSNNFHEPIVLPTEKIMWTPNFKVVKLVNNNPGNYTAWVKGNSEVSIVVYGKTNLTFEYGFSEFVPKSLADTSKQPIAGKEHYLSISVRDPHEVNIERAAILSVDEKVLKELTLNKTGTNFHVTDHFLPPDTTFKVAVKGTIIRTGKPIVRVSKISVQPRLPDAKIPSVTIQEGLKIEVNYNSNISLTCEVSAYPKPKIQWGDSDRNMLESQSSMIEFPYKYISNVKMNHIKRSKSYICKASNDLGTTRNSIQINVISPIKWIVSLPAFTRAEYEKELKLICLTHSPYPTVTQWYFNGPQEKLLLSADGSELTIKDMDINRQGQYICKVFLKDDPKIAESQTTQVEIVDLAPPEIRYDSGHIVVPEKSKAMISCRIVKGTPRPQISWQYRKNDGSELISLHESSQDLTINDVSLNHSGKYVCTGTNVYGNATAVAELEVLKSPEILNDGDSHAHVLYDARHVFTCRVIAHPSPTILWKDELGMIVHSTEVPAYEYEFTSQLDLQHIKKNSTYSCFAENSVGKSALRQFVASVEPPIKHGSQLNVVQKAKYGEKIILDCDITSNFPIERNWIVNRSKEFIKSDDKYSLTKDARGLIIKFVDINLQGTYVCRVRLEADPNILVEKNITLFIKDLAPPKLTTSKDVINKTFTARCVITRGVPQPVITWKFKGDSEEFKDLGVKGEVLTIKNIQRRHNGSYQCIGENAIGTDRAILSLEVEESPEIVTKKTEYRGVVGDKILVISCNATGYPTPTIVWKHSNNEIIRAGPKYTIKGSSNILSLYILNPMENDSDKLICQAKNKAGTITKTFDVLVVSDVTEELGNKHNVYLLENDSKDINCPLPDYDSYSLRWYKNGYLTNFTGTTYSIKKATVWDDGNYTCRANTDVGSVSETFVVDVGYKPTFQDSITLIVWYGDEEDVDCIVRAKPAAKVEWLFDGERSNIKEFKHRIHSWGKYKCIVTNFHGVVEKTVTVITSGCLINRTMEENNLPLIVNTNINADSDIPALNNNNYMFIETGQKMKLTCYQADKNTFKLFPDKDTIIAKCDTEDKFNSEGKTYTYSDLKCKKPLKLKLKTTEKSCINVDSKMIEVGFEVPDFVGIYEVCYDNKLSLPNFVYSKLSQQNLGNQEKNWTGKSPTDAVKDINYCGEESKCCYGKGQLINAADVDIGPPQITPFVDLNAISVWKPCEKQNRMTWRKLEEAVRSLLLSYSSIQVWSGASGYENVDVPTAPRYLWKVLKENRDIIAVIVYVNTPDPKTEDIKCKKPEDTPSELKIGDDPFTYLCTLEEFGKAFGVPMDTFSRSII